MSLLYFSDTARNKEKPILEILGSLKLPFLKFLRVILTLLNKKGFYQAYLRPL